MCQVLPLTRHHPVHQLVNWCEVFPTRQSLSYNTISMAEGDAESRVFLLGEIKHKVTNTIHHHIITLQWSAWVTRCSGSSWRPEAAPPSMVLWSGQTHSMLTRL